ncbi:modifier of mdg4-like isoform X10 [Bacillus rossius redtenbacheri]|uniref:modifier of mdg4-like isoform X10 n=1 Tax=Bacillus rossius redtenbacheri TaxID=93214 RepID=UPI002FDDAA27
MANADEQFSLRWNNFHSNLSSGFHAFLQGEDLVDVTLAAGGKFLQAHKLVLSVCSPYFKELFKVNPCKHPIVILKDVGHKELEDILEFMYRGEVNVRQDDLTEFLKTAEMLQVKGLTGDESNSDQQGSSQVPPPSPAPLQSSVKVKPRKPQPKAPPVDSMPPSPMTDDMPTRSPAADLNPPPFKRMKQESQSQPSPQQQFKQETQSQQQYKTQSLSSPSPRRLPPASPLSIADDSSRGVEFVEVTKPKMEPVDIESDVEEVDAGIDDKTDFSDFFGGESSQSHQDAPGMGMLPGMSMSGMSQDMGMPQDGGQVRFVARSSSLGAGNACLTCGRRFSNKYNLKVHMRDAHSRASGPIECGQCGRSLKNLSSLRVHMYERHLRDTSSGDVNICRRLSARQ